MANSVKAILDLKGRDVVTAGPNTTVSEAAAILSKKKIGAIVVVGMENKISGMFTERDLVHVIAKAGKDGLDQTLSSVMTSKVLRCNEQTSVNELMELMTSKRFRHVPVETNGKLAGIISIGDVVKSRIAEVEREAEEIKAYIAS
ncbi:CBS domain-containing protein [Rhizobium sp. BK196]|jgi:CBS domain-containing protein|uniref:CBS domain-containing protein n=1 Tax=unclassified Rhizobium TaxID=2613769 RepID=UPI00161EDB41|nr:MULTISPECIES: CBS domain-containing protein [unclassified Rhizobium]MBB3312044.1 CBS domain-containing protein [Rhizobium sp. BK196]MBB3464801.1 CBS domain-containing protein [Rhizobium sp. BK377]